jgi:L-aspartate oxidase
LVFGARAGRAMRATRGSNAPPGRQVRGRAANLAAAPALSAGEIRELMWRDAGLFRTREGLDRATQTLDAAWGESERRIQNGEALDAAGWTTVSLLTVARLIARAARRREESRGAHYREDHPQKDDIHWKRRIADERATEIQEC